MSELFLPQLRQHLFRVQIGGFGRCQITGPWQQCVDGRRIREEPCFKPANGQANEQIPLVQWPLHRLSYHTVKLFDGRGSTRISLPVHQDEACRVAEATERLQQSRRLPYESKWTPLKCLRRTLSQKTLSDAPSTPTPILTASHRSHLVTKARQG